MSEHRNPRARLAKPRPAANPHTAAIRRRRARRLALRATFARLAVENPRLAGAVLVALKIIAGANRRRAAQLVEAVSTIVVASPARAPGSEQP